jgi:DNA-3-methyladenine glycosylase
MPRTVGHSYFAKSAVELAPLLIGMVIEANGCSARIVEVEAYSNDPASHAFRRTERSALMFDTYGFVYVYLIYGRNHCLNFTCDRDREGAVLIRAAEPLSGIELMRKRRGLEETHRLCRGPGNLCKALGLDLKDNGKKIGETLKLFHGAAGLVATSPRIGITKATDLHWRFYEAGNPCVSGKRIA